MTGLSDSFQRPIDYLRISVTDRCDLRCIYCMPSDGICPMKHSDILTYEEIREIVQVAAELGIKKVRLTGGEPLVRLGLSQLIKILASIETIDDISLTTNGTLLSHYAGELKEAGLRRVNISLDTLKPDRFKYITRSNYEIGDVLNGLEVARAASLNPVKINVVVIVGINDDELIDFARKTIDEDWHVRFIELMLSAGTGTTTSQFISVGEMRKRLETLGELEPCSPGVGNGPAKYFSFSNAKGTVGFISPVSEHFCIRCNRLRLTADGKLRLCLLSNEEIDLRQPLRKGVSSSELKQLIQEGVARKPLCHSISEGNRIGGRPMTHIGG